MSEEPNKSQTGLNAANPASPSGSTDVATVALWEALEALLTRCDGDILFQKCLAQEEARSVLGQTEHVVQEAKQRLGRLRSIG